MIHILIHSFSILIQSRLNSIAVDNITLQVIGMTATINMAVNKPSMGTLSNFLDKVSIAVILLLPSIFKVRKEVVSILVRVFQELGSCHHHHHLESISIHVKMLLREHLFVIVCWEICKRVDILELLRRMIMPWCILAQLPQKFLMEPNLVVK